MFIIGLARFLLAVIIEKNLFSTAGISVSKIKIHEIYRSIQGESTHVGRPCTFVRTSGCKLRCVVDTKHAYHDGSWMDIESIISAVKG